MLGDAVRKLNGTQGRGNANQHGFRGIACPAGGALLRGGTSRSTTGDTTTLDELPPRPWGLMHTVPVVGAITHPEQQLVPELPIAS